MGVCTTKEHETKFVYAEFCVALTCVTRIVTDDGMFVPQ